mgnify:CR=1 FL=1|jgi:hypothetical protein|tara:strand:- start:315 stop:1082 length:768 start_codon:yes stop_codon:yes gene_type:complete
MKNNKTNFLIKLCYSFVLIAAIQSCQSNSKSGLKKMIETAMAKKEGNKKSTTPRPNTIIKDREPKIISINEIVTPKEDKRIRRNLINSKIPKVQGKLIQVEGLVLKEVTELTIKLETSASQIEQILIMKDYVFKNWHYIFDPESGKDTWRSAEATISLKYKNKYSGDCDDFAILLASFARQIGLESRMIGGFSGNSGHAFAEFLLPNRHNNIITKLNSNNIDYRKDYRGIWISLDWFQGSEHNKFLKNFKVYDNI